MKRLTRLFLLGVLIVTLAACSSIAAESVESAATSVAVASPVGSSTTDLDNNRLLKPLPLQSLSSTIRMIWSTKQTLSTHRT
jgi:hypothetical protein